MAKLCAIISRHVLTDKQKESLHKLRGIDEFVQVDGVYSAGWKAWEDMLMKCGRRPDLIVAVLPDQVMLDLWNRVGDRIEILEAEMFSDNGQWVWTGMWNTLKGFRRIRVPILETV